jgi:hypothetical protein
MNEEKIVVSKSNSQPEPWRAFCIHWSELHEIKPHLLLSHIQLTQKQN